MTDKTHLPILKQGISAWNRWRIENPEIKPNLAGADLSGLDLTRANLSHSDLRRAGLYKTTLQRANLSQADLREAALREADLRRASLRGANLSRANLWLANLREADLRRVARWGTRLSRLYRAIILFGVVFLAGDLYATFFAEADLIGAPLFGLALFTVTWSALNLRSFLGLSTAYVSTAFLAAGLWDQADLWSELPSSLVFIAALLWIVTTIKALGQGPLPNTDLSGADLRGANLYQAKLEGVNFSRAYLRGVNLWGTRLIDITYDQHTVWPYNFVPPTLK